jgi:hypothetical protein
MWRMEWLPPPAAVWVMSALLASRFGFANREAKDETGAPGHKNADYRQPVISCGASPLSVQATATGRQVLRGVREGRRGGEDPVARAKKLHQVSGDSLMRLAFKLLPKVRSVKSPPLYWATRSQQG